MVKYIIIWLILPALVWRLEKLAKYLCESFWETEKNRLYVE